MGEVMLGFAGLQVCGLAVALIVRVTLTYHTHTC